MFTLEQYRELMQEVIEEALINNPENSYQSGYNAGMLKALELMFLTDED